MSDWMLDWSYFAPIALFAFVTVITPGPNNIIIATSAVNFGLAKSAPAIVGVIFGFAAMMLIVAVGGGLVFSRAPMLHDLMRWASLGYMCWLAWKIAVADVADERKSAHPPEFLQMAVFQWVNPKAWAVCTGAATVFATGKGGVMVEAILITKVFFLVSVPCHFFWGIFGAGVGGFLRGSPIRLRVFNIAMAVLMIAAFAPAMLAHAKKYFA